MSADICDFCLASCAAGGWVYNLVPGGFDPLDAWLACNRCSGLIDAGLVELLLTAATRANLAHPKPSWPTERGRVTPAFLDGMRGIFTDIVANRSSKRELAGYEDPGRVTIEVHRGGKPKDRSDLSKPAYTFVRQIDRMEAKMEEEKRKVGTYRTELAELHDLKRRYMAASGPIERAPIVSRLRELVAKHGGIA